MTRLLRPDGNTVLTSYTGRATDVQDEGNGSRRVERVTQVDAFGNLTSACEVSSTTLLGTGSSPVACGQDISRTGFLTTYGYDVLGNLQSVTQSGVNRAFTYDGLSRLLTASNPESGTTTYGYNPDSTLATRTRPSPNQYSTYTLTTTYTYDAVHRLTQAQYSDTNPSPPYSTPSVTHNYDQSSVWAHNLSNYIGRLTNTSRGSICAGEVFSYDPMGRVVRDWQQIPTCAAFGHTYTYDFLGNPTYATDGVIGVAYSPSYSQAGRLISITSTLNDAQHPGTLVSGLHYNPLGQVTAGSLGNGASFNQQYDSRGRLTSIVNSSILYSLGLTYNPNSTIQNGNDSVNKNWTYTYDDFNRLKTSAKTNQGFSYDYDRFGNRWHQNVTLGSGPAPQYAFDTKNHITSMTYDSAGNVTNDGYHTYTYDAEGMIVTVDGGSTAGYVYDAFNRRVRKTVASTNYDYTYDLQGRQLGIYSNGPYRNEIYAAGLHVGTYFNSTTYFHQVDWLGSERAHMDVNGNLYETCTNLAFGDGQTCVGNEITPLHFTGQERDTESNLDNFGARNYSSTMGRFMRPDDPFADQHPGQPQSWNLYSYVRNNPLSNTDPSGSACLTDDNNSQKWSGSGETCEDVAQQNQEYQQEGLAGVSVNGCEGEGAADCLAFGVSDLTSTSSLSQVGVNGIIGAQAAEGIWNIPGVLRSGWDLVAGWRLASKMAGVRAAGEAGELAAGIIKNTEHIPSTTGATYRIPDILDHANKIIGEVKNYSTTRVYLTNQLKDDLAYAAANGYTMELRVRQGAQLSQSVQQLVDQGTIKLIKF